MVDDGYTACCNELVCYGGDQVWTDGERRVHACCGAKAEAQFVGEDGEVGVLLAGGGGGAGLLAGEGVVTMKPTWLMDAGELREWVVERFGQQLVVGGPRVSEGLRWVRRLAQRAGLPYDEVLADVVADAEARFA